MCPGQSGKGHQLRSARLGETFATVATSAAARLAPQVCVAVSVAQSPRQACLREVPPHWGCLPAGPHYQLRRLASFSSSDEAEARSHGTESDEKDACHPPKYQLRPDCTRRFSFPSRRTVSCLLGRWSLAGPLSYRMAGRRTPAFGLWKASLSACHYSAVLPSRS